MKSRICLLVAIFALLMASTAFAKTANSFFFVQLADTQLGFTNGNQNMDPEITNFEKAVEHINRLKPAFVLISGDMVNLPHDPEQIREFWRIARKIRPDVPLHLLPGNHDIGNPTVDNIRSYEKLFGKDHYSFSYKGSEFVVLDSNLYWDKDGNSNLRDAQKKWFEGTLANARKHKTNHLFVCTHQSWFINSPDDSDSYECVPKTVRQDYLNMMKLYGVDFALAGHIHREAIAHYGQMEMITTSAISKGLGKDPVGLRVFRVYPDKVSHTYYLLGKVPDKIKL